MEKIKKGLNIKIMSLIIIVLFIFNNTALYGIPAYNRAYLRTPLLGNSDKGKARLEEAVSIDAQQNKPMSPQPKALLPHEARALKAAETEDIPDEGIRAMAEHILELTDPKIFSTEETRQIRIDGLREDYIPIIERRNGDPKFVVQFNRAMGRLLELKAVQESRSVEDFIGELLSCRIYIRWTKENFLWMLKEACTELNTVSNEVIGNHPLYGRLSQVFTRYRAEWGYETWKEAISDIGLSPDSLDTITEKIIRLGKEIGVEIGEGDARRIATNKRDGWKAFVEKLPKEIRRLLDVTKEIHFAMKPNDAMSILIDRPDTWEEFVRKLPDRIKRIVEISKELNLRITPSDAMDIVIHKSENWERFVRGMPGKIKKIERLAEKIGFTERTGIGLSNSEIRYLIIQVSNPERFVIRLPSRIGRVNRITVLAGINLAPGDAKYIALYHPSYYRKFAEELAQRINEIMRIGGELGINLSLNDAKFIALREKNPETTVRSLPAKIYNISKEATRLEINPTERQVLTLAIDRPNVFSGILGVAKGIKNYAGQELGVELGDARAVELASDYTRAWGIKPEDWRRERVLSSTRAIIVNFQKAASVFSDILGRSVSEYEVGDAIERVKGRGIEPIFRVVEREIIRKYPIFSSRYSL